MTTFGFIPARGASKRVPGKNLREVGGKSLVQRAVECARDAGLDHVIVSTEDLRVAMHGDQLHVAVDVCPTHTDTSQIEDAIHWSLQRGLLSHDHLRAGPEDVIVILQPTSPFRRPETVAACVHLLTEHGLDSVLTVSLDPKRTVFAGRLRGLWDDATQREIGKRVVWDRVPIRPRTQDVEAIPIENGCCYAVRLAHLRATESRMGGREAVVPVGSIEAWDIDTEDDLRIAQAIASMDKSEREICKACDRGWVSNNYCSRCGSKLEAESIAEGET